MLNLGLGTGTLRHVAGHRASNDKSALLSTISTNTSLSLILAILCCTAALFLAGLVYYFHLFHISVSLLSTACIAILLIGMQAGLRLIDQVFINVFKAFERFDLSAIYNISCRVLMLGVSVALILTGHGILWMLAANNCIMFFNVLLQWFMVKKVTEIPKLSFGFSIEKIKLELSYSRWVWLQSLLVIITYQLDRYAVTSLPNGLILIGSYGLVATIFNHIHMGFEALVPWMFPRFAHLHKKEETAAPLYSSMRSMISGFAILSLCAFSLCYPFIFMHWLGADKYKGLLPYMNRFMLFELVFAFTIVPFQLMNAYGMERKSFWINLILCSTTCLAILLGRYVFFSPEYIIYGMAAATTLSLPILYASINQRLYEQSSMMQTLLFLLPIIPAACFLFVDAWYLKIAAILLLLLFMLPIYFNRKVFNLKLLLK
jgi:O-antigen/teichoic acid export membrane protein